MSATWHDRDRVFDGTTGWDDGAVVAEIIDDDTTTVTVLAVQDRRESGEHPAWTQGISRAVHELERKLEVAK